MPLLYVHFSRVVTLHFLPKIKKKGVFKKIKQLNPEIYTPSHIINSTSFPKVSRKILLLLNGNN